MAAWYVEAAIEWNARRRGNLFAGATGLSKDFYVPNPTMFRGYGNDGNGNRWVSWRRAYANKDKAA